MSFLEIPPEILLRPEPDLPAEPWREFEPNSIAQGQALNSWARLVGYSGRLGSSKSRTCCESAYWDACFWPGNRVLLTRKRASDLFATTFQLFMDEVLPPELKKFYRPGAAGGPTLFLPNRSRILFFGLDEPMKVRSAVYGSIKTDQGEDLDEDEKNNAEARLRHRVRPAGVDEAMLRALWPDVSDQMADRLLTRGVPLRRQMLYAFNPSGDYHWANILFKFKEMQQLPESDPAHWRRVYRTTEPRKLLDGTVLPAGRVMAEAIIARPQDNTENLPEDYQLGLTSYVGDFADRMVRGIWGTYVGQVLKNYRPDIHVIDRPGDWDQWGGCPPPSWSRFRSVDFGYGPGHPFVMSWYARRPAKRIAGFVRPAKDYLYQEIYWTGRTVPEHAETANRWDAEELAALNRGIDRWNEEHEEKRLRPLRHLDFSGQWGDPGAPGDIATLAAYGISLDPAINERSPGAQLVTERLEPVKWNPDADSEPRLVIVRTARRDADPALVAEAGKRPTQTFEELPGIVWVKKGKSEERGQKEDWVKDRDDGFDAMRYFLLSERERGSMDVVAI